MRSLKLWVIGMAVIIGMLLPDLTNAANYHDQDFINAIVGEAGNQGYQGMLAVACALRNRMRVPYYRDNVLSGVYGANAKHLSKESRETFRLAEKAWIDSKMNNIVGSAYIWGTDSDIRKFRTQDWFNNMVPVVKIGDHTFFKGDHNAN